MITASAISTIIKLATVGLTVLAIACLAPRGDAGARWHARLSGLPASTLPPEPAADPKYAIRPFEIVISHYQEEPGWVHDTITRYREILAVNHSIAPYVIVLTKNLDPATVQAQLTLNCTDTDEHGCANETVALRNVGRETESFLWFIVQRYDSLAEYTLGTALAAAAMQTSPGLASAAEPLRGARNGNGKPARSLKPLLLFGVAALIIAAGVYPQLPARQKKPQKVLWFMAIASDEKVQPCRAMIDCPRAVQRAENMFDEYALYGKVALLSAKKYAPSVVPIMLYPGNYNAYMKWFEQEGGLAFHHRTSLLPRWQGAVAAGNVSETIYMAESLYLRFDIPIIMPDVMEALKAKGFDVSNINSTHVFFTDNDAVWVNDFNTDIIPHTDVVAIGAEATPGTVGNAGILYINVEGAREPFADMYNWAELKWWWRNPYTQHMLLQYFEPTGLVTQLPDAYNYKPYWGNVKGEARCVHFHGPKPDRCLPCYLNVARLNPARIEECNCTHYDKLWQMGIDADNGDFFARLQDEFQDFRQMPDTYSDTSLS